MSGVVGFRCIYNIYSQESQSNASEQKLPVLTSEAGSESHATPQNHGEGQSYSPVHPSAAGQDPNGDGYQREDERE